MVTQSPYLSFRQHQKPNTTQLSYLLLIEESPTRLLRTDVPNAYERAVYILPARGGGGVGPCPCVIVQHWNVVPDLQLRNKSLDAKMST